MVKGFAISYIFDLNLIVYIPNTEIWFKANNCIIFESLARGLVFTLSFVFDLCGMHNFVDLWCY